MDYLKEINDRFPIRRKDEQKKAFRAWTQKQANALGYSAKVQPLGKTSTHNNLVIGDPEDARVLFTAHYDTPAMGLFPNLMMPRNVPLFFLYQLLIVAVLLAVSFCAALGVQAVFHLERRIFAVVFLGFYFALLFLMMKGFPNKHNVNDNTSGVAAIFSIMERLPPENRGKVAFLLFDNEEKGKLGSKAYAKEHLQIQYGKMVVNLDCVGVGDTIVVICKRLAQRLPEYAQLKNAFKPTDKKAAAFYGSFGSICNSDQQSFKCSIVVMACKKAPVVGYYTARIHTGKDTIAQADTIEYLSDSLSSFAGSL